MEVAEYPSMRCLYNKKRIVKHIKYLQVHLKDEISGDWVLLFTIPVKSLSAEPDIPANNTLITLSGVFSIRVAARNLAVLGAAAELEIVVNG